MLLSSSAPSRLHLLPSLSLPRHRSPNPQPNPNLVPKPLKSSRLCISPHLFCLQPNRSEDVNLSEEVEAATDGSCSLDGEQTSVAVANPSFPVRIGTYRMSLGDQAFFLLAFIACTAIKEKILALDFRELAVDVMAVDAQKSLDGGMTVLVRGSLTGKNMVKKEFAQFFFLAAVQEVGFFVLNDIVRYVDGKNQLVRPSQSKLERIPSCNVSASHQSAAAGSYLPARVVGEAFVHKYYDIVHQYPQFAHRFYQECSTLGRSDSYGVMGSVTTMNGIKAKFLEMNFKNFHVDIKTVDAQESLRGGVAILVIGSLIRKNVVKHFIQSFFLAPQEKGYFVLNDIFRYVDDDNRWLGSVDMLTELFKRTRLNKNNTIPSARIVPNPLHLDPKASEASAPAGPPVSDGTQLDMAANASIKYAVDVEFFTDKTDNGSKRKPEDPKEGSSNSINTSESCVICWDARTKGACIPCGHMAGCMSCLNKIEKKKLGCHVCRAKVAQVVRIYAVW